MNEEELVFERILDALELPEPDLITKERVMKAVFFLIVAKEVGTFYASIPWILATDTFFE